MKKAFITIATIFVVSLSSVFFITPVSADPLEELEKREAKVQQDREKLKKSLSKAEAEIADLLIEKEELNEEINQVNAALKENKKTLKQNKKDITAAQKEINKLEKEIAELEEAIEKRFNILKERAVAYQKNGGNISYIEVLFGAESFGDFISRVSAVNKITESDAQLMEQINEDIVEIEKKQNKVQAKLDELNELNTELKGMQALIKEQQKENESKKSDLKEKEAALVKKVNELEMKDSKLAALEKEVKQNIKEITQPAPATQIASVNSDTTGDEGKAKGNSDSKQAVRSASGGAQSAINAGFTQLGTPYVWGGKTPSGFDCSGFVSWAFAQSGISIPSSTSGLQSVGKKVSVNNMQPGDLVFFNTYKTNGHVGIYLGNGKFLGAQNSTGVAVADLTSGYWGDKFAGHARSVR